MVKINPFEVEQWMDRYETTPGVLNVAETCAASVSIDDLVALCKDENAPGPLALSTKLTYGAIRGSQALRQNVASLFDRPSLTPLSAEGVVITQGAIVANFLLFYTLVGPGDHVICVYPTYQQLYAVPESLGAEVSLWALKEENGYIPDIGDLEKLVKTNTKMIVINNPNNPLGQVIPTLVLKALVAFAEPRGIIILSDEVYSPLYHSLPEGQEAPPSILALGYEKAVVTGSMSKAFALAGIRIGWIASRDAGIIEAVLAARDYTTISVSQLDDQIATYALSNLVLPALLKRNTALAQTNLASLSALVERHGSVCSWVKPTAGTTALIQFRKKGVPVDDSEFVLDLLEKTKVLVMPGSVCFGLGKDFKGFIRLGYVCETGVLNQALEQLELYINDRLV
ncbi:pyridoxal phosphate-dependent transferase [Lasiosphaeria miniovina]|uniref:Pyridoxal phosphate-dependent transferase n=1 Tax=Lasiosphaeria miniovina TaxID=1954250 RepID=A0AA40BIX3_9PEZI|nr:pyridoxal phosphate-dependent transferase [Lasiosphaeria miniovina]KAK0735054.1 pyridoxal phosphate-dependent transferase [Lasiosphaeria miniovina]